MAEFNRIQDMHDYRNNWNHSIQCAANKPLDDNLSTKGRFKQWADYASVLRSILYETWERLIDHQQTIDSLRRTVSDLETQVRKLRKEHPNG